MTKVNGLEVVRQSESKSAGGKLEHVASSSEAIGSENLETGEILETAQALQQATGTETPKIGAVSAANALESATSAAGDASKASKSASQDAAVAPTPKHAAMQQTPGGTVVQHAQRPPAHQFEGVLLAHNLALGDPYASIVQNDSATFGCNEPDSARVIDYIFFGEQNLRPLRALTIAKKSDLYGPTPSYPSDHLAIGVDFTYTYPANGSGVANGGANGAANGTLQTVSEHQV